MWMAQLVYIMWEFPWRDGLISAGIKVATLDKLSSMQVTGPWLLLWVLDLRHKACMRSMTMLLGGTQMVSIAGRQPFA